MNMSAESDQLALRKEIDLTSLCIDGERLRLRSVVPQYAESIFREFTGEITRYMIPKPAEDIAETRAFIRASQEGMQAQYEVVLAILAKPEVDGGEEELLGCCGLHGRGRNRTPELGIWLKAGTHGQGFGRETIVILSKWALEHVDFDYLIYPADRANTASWRIPASMGGELFEEKRVPTMRGTELDEVVYKLTPEMIAAV